MPKPTIPACQVHVTHAPNPRLRAELLSFIARIAQKNPSEAPKKGVKAA